MKTFLKNILFPKVDIQSVKEKTKQDLLMAEIDLLSARAHVDYLRKKIVWIDNRKEAA